MVVDLASQISQGRGRGQLCPAPGRGHFRIFSKVLSYDRAGTLRWCGPILYGGAAANDRDTSSVNSASIFSFDLACVPSAVFMVAATRSIFRGNLLHQFSPVPTGKISIDVCFSLEVDSGRLVFFRVNGAKSRPRIK